MDVSATGLRIRLSSAIHRGTQVQVLVEKAAAFGTVRYCRANSVNTYDVGLIIDQVVMRPGGPPIEPLDVATERDSFAKLQQRRTATTADPVDVLLVEDNPAEQLSIKELLGYDDIDVTVAATGGEALAIAGARSFDCVVLDLRLPDMSGFEVLERLHDIHIAGRNEHGNSDQQEDRRAQPIGALDTCRRFAGGCVYRQGVVSGGGCPTA